jgi:hypothetical protein
MSRAMSAGSDMPFRSFGLVRPSRVMAIWSARRIPFASVAVRPTLLNNSGSGTCSVPSAARSAAGRANCLIPSYTVSAPARALAERSARM